MTDKTDKELRKIAADMVEGKIFADVFCENPNDIPMVFMPLVLMSKDELKELSERDIGLMYEYVKKALPRSVNGKPCFMSFRLLSTAETKKVYDYFHKYKELKEGFITEDPPE